MQWAGRNTMLKIVSLALATITWFFVKGVTSDSRLIEGVPVEIKVRPGWALLGSSLSTVNVVVRGTREDVRQVTRQELSAVVDLTREERRGQWTVRLGPKAIRHSRRVQVTDVTPQELSVTVDELVERELKVAAQLSGELPAGLVVERVATRPETVRLKGPKSQMDRLAAAETLPIDLTGRRMSFREHAELVPLEFPNGLAQRRWVEVDVRIGPARPVDSAAGRGVEQSP